MPDLVDRIRQTAPGHAVQAADNLVLFRIDRARFRYGQSYALLRDDHTVLVDAVHAASRAAVDALRQRAAPVAALVLTHRDLLGQAWGSPAELADTLGAPVLIHALDRQGSGAQSFEDVGELMESLGLSIAHVPGHTPGSSVITAVPEGFAFCGDAAVGARYADDAVTFSHAPIAASDWPGFAAGWRTVPAPSALLPLHGQPAFAVDEWDALRDEILTPDNIMRQ